MSGIQKGIEPQPPGSKFEGNRRMPGWQPDRDFKPDTYLFPEEAHRFHAGTTGTVVDPFAPPNTTSQLLVDNAFDGKGPLPPSPSPEQIQQANQWLSFCQWMVGAPFNDGGTTFDAYLKDLQRAVRIYNAKLYFTRRLHYAENAPGASATQQYPPNPHNNVDGQPEPASVDKSNYAQWVPAAQREWNAAALVLDRMLDWKDPSFPYPFKEVVVEMVQVNGYITAMRVIAGPKSNGSIVPMQVGGSSSSQIRISSGFSSPSP